MKATVRAAMARPDRVLVALVLLFTAGLAGASSTQGVRMVPYDQFAAAGVEPQSQTVYLDPTQGWAGSNVFLKVGDLVTVTATGLADPGVRIKRGPDGSGTDLVKEMTHNCAYMELLGRIGEGTPFCVGSAATFEVVEGGHLSFHVNELDSLRFDDYGSFHITVRWFSPGAPRTTSSGAGPASGPVMTAVLDLVPLNVSEPDAAAFSSQLRASLSSTGRAIIIDPGQVEAARKKLNLSRADYANPATAAQLGRSIGAATVITGQIGKIGNSYSLTLMRVNPLTGAVERTVAEVLDGPSNKIPERLAAMVQKL